MKDFRKEGIYPSWHDYPARQKSVIGPNMLEIERVNGDGTVAVFSCTRGEAKKLKDFLSKVPAFANGPRVQ